MARIRHISIKNFRCIKEMDWYPRPGINCLIGPGDSGKSSVLDAIDLCLGARRSIHFTDADFHGLEVEEPVEILITLGELADSLKSFESYGLFLRGYDALLGCIEDEPAADTETVITIKLSVGTDLEPVWSLVSERAAAQGHSRFLSWADRVRLAPLRIGALADHHLAWRRGSVLNRLSDERADASAALAKAAREARAAFGDLAEAQLGDTLSTVLDTANQLGIAVGDQLKAMLDAHSVSFAGGTIALHGGDGVPLRALGIGSTRLLVAGLQRKAAEQGTMVLVDELEHGLEPHRIIRFLHSMGARDPSPPLQAFVTTHSPVVLQELSGDQLMVVRANDGRHRASRVGTTDALQGTIRKYPHAFLALAVLVCEGASEVGFLRGLDQYRTTHGYTSITASGVALIDAGGCDNLYLRANALRTLQYRTAVLRDDDKQPDASVESEFLADGAQLFKWRAGRALEDELFLSLPSHGVRLLVQRAIELHGEELVEAHIISASSGSLTTDGCLSDLSAQNRRLLGKAARTKKGGWFKTTTWMEEVARDIVGPCLGGADLEFTNTLDLIFGWIADGAD